MVRRLLAAPFFVLAAFFAFRSIEPLRIASSGREPRGLYLTIWGIGLALAGLFAAIGLVVASRWFTRYGGLLAVSGLAVVAGTLPYMIFKWSVAPETVPWAHFAQDGIVWLGFGPRTLLDGALIQMALTVVAIASAGGQLMVWITPAGGRRSDKRWTSRRSRNRTERKDVSDPPDR